MSKTIPCELVSWAEVNRLCWQLSTQIKTSGFRPEMVVAIGRGGYVPARLICDALDIMALTSIKIEHYLSGSEKQAQAVIRYPLSIDIKGRRVLVVDDVNDSGDTLQLAVEHLQTFHPQEVSTAVMHDKHVTHYKVDYFAKRIIKWRWLIYPWAVNEDVSAFTRHLSPAPQTLMEAQHRLKEQFGIRISLRLLHHINATSGLPMS